MSKTLQEIRKKLESLSGNGKGGSSNSTSSDKSTYAHWGMEDGKQSIVRFLEDGDEDNTFFWAERQTIKMPFKGIKGHDENKVVTVQVPCIEMWDGKMTCPILNEIRPMWKDPKLEPIAKSYWVKKSYYMHGFVKQDGVDETDPPENPIRKFIMGPQIFKIIQANLMDPEMENSPVDHINGTDFVVAKTMKGGYADYGTSKWARKETSLSEAQIAAIEKYGLPKLKDYLPKRPSDEQVEIMYKMFQASVDGKPYDPKLWGNYYKPFGFDTAPNKSEDYDVGGKKVVSKVKSVVEDQDDLGDDVDLAEKSFEPASGNSGEKKSVQDILAMLHNRKQQ